MVEADFESTVPDLGHASMPLLLRLSEEVIVQKVQLLGMGIASENALGPDHLSLGTPLNNLASLYEELGRYAEAESLFKRSLAITEKALGPIHPDVGLLFDNLGKLLMAQGRDTEAESLYKRSLAIRERALGPDDAAVGRSLNNLAHLYRAQGRNAEAERLYERALAISKKVLGDEHLGVAVQLSNIGELHTQQGRYADAERQLKRALSIQEKALGPHPDVAASLNALAELYRKWGRGTEAEPLYERSLAIREKAYGSSDHREVAQSLNNLALLYEERREYAKAEQYYERSLAISRKTLGPDHPDLGRLLNNLAGLHFAQQQWTRASDYLRQSADLIIRRMKRGTATSGLVLTAKGKSEAERESQRFWTLVKAAYRVADVETTRRPELARGMFGMAQWAGASEAATALAQMATRQAKGDGVIARLVRERQDLVGEWQTRDEQVTREFSLPTDKRNAAVGLEQRARIGMIDAASPKLTRLWRRLFPSTACWRAPNL